MSSVNKFTIKLARAKLNEYKKTLKKLEKFLKDGAEGREVITLNSIKLCKSEIEWYKQIIKDLKK